MLGACLIAEVIRAVTKYRSFAGNAVAYAVFGFRYVRQSFAALGIP